MAAVTYTTTLLVKATPADGRAIEKELAFSAEAAPVQIDVDVPDSSTDLEVSCLIDFSELKLLMIVVDGELTIETNDGAAPDDTIGMGGSDEEVYVWTEEDEDTVVLTADVTALFLSNSSGSTVRFQLLAVYDVTP